MVRHGCARYRFIGGIVLILGFCARWIALALAPILLGAIATVHAANGFGFLNPGGGSFRNVSVAPTEKLKRL